MSDNNTEQAIKDDVNNILDLERTLQATEAELMTNEVFRQFLEMQKTYKEQSATVWANIEKAMLDNNIKNIKGDWGSLTITERIGFDIDADTLPKKFYKTVIDTKKVADTYRLEGKVKGASVKYTKYLTKRIK